MAKFKRKITEKVSSKYTAAERKAITQDVVDFIRKRTDKGKDKNNKSFPSYSKEYKSSTTFKESGKSSKVNLKLTEDMMNDFDGLSSSKGEIAYGFKANSDELGKAEGNVLGTYGQKTSTGKKRDFMGITKGDLSKILSRYPAGKAESKERATLINALSGLAKKEAEKQAGAMVAAGTVTEEVAKEFLEGL